MVKKCPYNNGQTKNQLSTAETQNKREISIFKKALNRAQIIGDERKRVPQKCVRI